MGEEGLKEILLLRVYPSRFSGIPNRGTPPITMVFLLPRVHPGRVVPPAPQSPTWFTPPARGGGAISFRSTARSKMKIKRFWFYTIFFHMRPHITPGSEPFNCARYKNGYRPSAETWFSLIGLFVFGFIITEAHLDTQHTAKPTSRFFI